MLALKLAMAAAGSAGGAAWEGLNSLYFKWNNNVFPSNRQSATGVLKVQTTHPYNSNLQYTTGGSGNSYTTAIYINAAGTLYYAARDASSTILQFQLTSAYDFSTMVPYTPNVYNYKALPITENAIRGLYFSTDGSKFFILGTQGGKVYRFDMSTNWDITSASQHSDTYTLTGSNPYYGVWFKPDGTRFFLCIYGDFIKRFDLSTAWDLSTVSTGTGSAWEYDDGQDIRKYAGVSFSADGTKLYRNGDLGTKIYQSTLTSAWELSTASYTGSFTNSALLNAGSSNSRGPSNQFIGSPIIDQNNGSRIIYGSKGFSLSRGYVVDMATLSTPYLISSASYATAASTAASRVWIDSTTSNSAGTNFIYFVNDGSAFFTVNTYGPYIRKYAMSTPYDLSSAPAAGSPTQTLTVTSIETTVRGFFFKPDGKVLLTIGNQGGGLDQWNLSTAWDLSTASHAGFQNIAGNNNFTFFTVKPDGTQVYYNQGTNSNQPRRLYYNTITNPWDITGGIGSASSTLLTDNANQYWNFKSGKFSDDGKQFYIVQTSQYHGNDLTQWTLSTEWDFSTFNSSPLHRGFYNLMYGLTDISFADDGKKMFLLSDVGPNAIYRYDFVA